MASKKYILPADNFVIFGKSNVYSSSISHSAPAVGRFLVNGFFGCSVFSIGLLIHLTFLRNEHLRWKPELEYDQR
jgi:hypothetical protein